MRKLTEFSASEIFILIIGLSYVIFASILLIKLIKTKINIRKNERKKNETDKI